jgi:protein-disulfide isomerase
MVVSLKFDLLVSTLVLAAACSSSAQQARGSEPVRAQTATDVVATVGGSGITLGQIDARALQMPASSFGNMKLSQALYEARRAALDEMVGDALIEREAKERGIDPAALTAQEITSKAAPVTDAEVTAWYQANQSRVQGAPIDQVRAPISNLLKQQRTQARREAFLDLLKKKTAVTIALDPPRQAVAEAGRPARGPAGAPIEMIEFSDFQCPYCLKANPTVTQVLNTYGDRIRFVYRNYPLPNHPYARPAAEAAQCANEQGKFWPYHDRLFANQQRLTVPDLKQHAAEVGLDTAKFNACLDSHKYASVVEKDIAIGNESGVDGTPAFFINGRMISGAQPFEAFKRIIDEELAARR